MSNTLTGLLPTLYESLDTVARELVGIIPAVTLDANVGRGAIGQTVLSVIAPAVTASNVTPGVTAPNDGDQVFANKTITISKSRYVPIRWNGEEERGLSTGPGYRNILRDQFSQAFRTLVNEMENDVVNVGYQNASRATGTPGTTPFQTPGDLSDFANVRQILEDNGAGVGEMHMVLGSAAIAAIRGKQNVLFRVNESGTEALLRKGIVGEVEGLMVHNSAQVRQVVAGTGTGYVSSGGTLPVGTTAIPLLTGAGTVLAGDAVTFAGDANKYVVNTGVAAPGTISIGSPGLRLALAAGTAMTIGASYTPNLAFASSGIVLSTRIPAVPVDMQGNAMDMADDRTIVQDPFSGLAFEVSLYRQYRQIKYEVAAAWGMGGMKSDFIATLRG